ncbi:hypothetical protein ANN_08720 [Periplaneta americana]|uniref:Uncharacterized protein n=1 Tax=Periplaneta americana TaxID=6978 RepID=A0ABQ8T262_PERAM|nr:hypothetical protein ANN_08720 [Periplaneta americana]
MLEVYHDEISWQIKTADFLAVTADGTSDVSNKFQMVVIYRYIHNNKPVERFWDFTVSTGHDAPSLAKSITHELDHHLGDCPRKLITQTYDGTSVMSGSLRGVQALVKQIYLDTAYVHCYAHQLNLIMQNAASANCNVKIFFANLQDLCTFLIFSSSPQRTAVLDEVVKKRYQDLFQLMELSIKKCHLSAAMLFLPEGFSEYSTAFPENHLQAAYTNYKFFDMKKLCTELAAIYEREEFRKITGALSMFDFINENNLNEAFSESVKLLKVLLTISMTTSEAEQNFSILKRNISAQHNDTGNTSGSFMLSVERNLIMQIPDFNQRVIGKFAASKDRKDFLFK